MWPLISLLPNICPLTAFCDLPSISPPLKNREVCPNCACGDVCKFQSHQIEHRQTKGNTREHSDRPKVTPESTVTDQRTMPSKSNLVNHWVNWTNLQKERGWDFTTEHGLLTGAQVISKEAMSPESLTPTHTYIDGVSSALQITSPYSVISWGQGLRPESKSLEPKL